MARKTLTALLVAFALIGLADSVYLTWDHGVFKADPTAYGGGMCGVGSGCHEAHLSSLSELPIPGVQTGLPTGLVALAFYAVFLGLTLWRHRLARDENGGETATLSRLAGLQVWLAALATLWSLSLLAYSLSQGFLCKFCAVLYVVNPVLLVLTWRARGDANRPFLAATGRTVFSRPALVAAVGMAVLLAGGYFAYRTALLSARHKPAVLDSGPGKRFDTAQRPTQGPATAPVHIVEFADFECPHCKIGFKTLEEVFAERKDVRLTFLNFPLDNACNSLVDRPFHLRACELATIGECAHEQGRFFDVAPLLFEAFPTPELLSKIAELGLDRPALEACMKDGRALERVKGDVAAGIAARLEGTPAVFMNGVLVGGVRSKEDLFELIEQAKARPATSATPPAPPAEPPK
jgi:protein-disulfide isomerase